MAATALRILPNARVSTRTNRRRPSFFFLERKVLTFIMRDESHASMRIFSFSNETRRRMLRRRRRKNPDQTVEGSKKKIAEKKNNLLRNRLFTHSSNTKKIWQAHRDSNSELSLRRGPFYPVELWALPEKANCSRFRGDSPRFPGSTTENQCVFRCTCLNRGSSFGSWRSPRELPSIRGFQTRF